MEMCCKGSVLLTQSCNSFKQVHSSFAMHCGSINIHVFSTLTSLNCAISLVGFCGMAAYGTSFDLGAIINYVIVKGGSGGVHPKDYTLLTDFRGGGRPAYKNREKACYDKLN